MKLGDDKSVGYWAHRVGTAFKRMVDAQAREIGLAGPEAILIHMLDHCGSSSLVELSRKLGHAHPSVLRHIDSLEESGFVERIPHAEDRRIKVVRLTNRGNEAIPKVNALVARVHQQAMEGLDQREIELLLGILRQIEANIGSEWVNDECVGH